MPGLCNVVEPALAPVAAGQMAACFLYPEVRAASDESARREVGSREGETVRRRDGP